MIHITVVKACPKISYSKHFNDAAVTIAPKVYLSELVLVRYFSANLCIKLKKLTNLVIYRFSQQLF
jgi:hypothetical protein